MSGGLRAYLAACAASVAFGLGYALPPFFHAPNLYYDPVARRFLLGARLGPLPMGYYGQVLWGLGLGAGAGLAAWALCGRRRREPSPATLTLATAWALTSFVVVGIYFTWNNWP